MKILRYFRYGYKTRKGADRVIWVVASLTLALIAISLWFVTMKNLSGQGQDKLLQFLNKME